MPIKRTFYKVRSGYDGTKCFVHARCCAAPDFLLATAQFLDVSGSDLFSGIYSCKSIDGGKAGVNLVQNRGLHR